MPSISLAASTSQSADGRTACCRAGAAGIRTSGAPIRRTGAVSTPEILLIDVARFDAKKAGDFKFELWKQFGIESPGLTSSLAIGEAVAERLAG